MPYYALTMIASEYGSFQQGDIVRAGDAKGLVPPDVHDSWVEAGTLEFRETKLLDEDDGSVPEEPDEEPEPEPSPDDPSASTDEPGKKREPPRGQPSANKLRKPPFKK